MFCSSTTCCRLCTETFLSIKQSESTRYPQVGSSGRGYHTKFGPPVKQISGDGWIEDTTMHEYRNIVTSQSLGA